mmetsp:Transcript_44177/g.70998  ORF Transcript_44177/g.70998 Transcript_44177/m.70998 type:complete len:231 (+) Transcript_44177:3-695(+)
MFDIAFLSALSTVGHDSGGSSQLGTYGGSDQAGSNLFVDSVGRTPIYQGTGFELDSATATVGECQPCALSVFTAGDSSVQTLHDASSLSADPYTAECDPMPGWKVNWNPPDCSDGSNGYPGGWGPEGRPPVAWVQTDGAVEARSLPHLALSQGPQAQTSSSKPSKPNPGHLLLCGHACLLGAMTATTHVLSGKSDVAKWNASFQKESSAAADSMTPVGGFVLRRLIFADT